MEFRSYEKNIKELQIREVIFKNVAMFLILLGSTCFIFSAIVFFSLYKYEGFAEYFLACSASLWALAGIIYIYVAFLGQKAEILQNSYQIELNREELKAQNDTLECQRFEGALFKMFNLLDSQISDLQIIIHSAQADEVFSRKRYFFYIFREFKNNPDININSGERIVASEERLPDSKDVQIKSLFRDIVYHNPELSSYLNTIDLIIRFIDNSSVKNKDFYFSYLSSRLSLYEKCIYFYYLFLKVETSGDVSKIVLKYRILSSLEKEEDELILPYHFKDFLKLGF